MGGGYVVAQIWIVRINPLRLPIGSERIGWSPRSLQREPQVEPVLRRLWCELTKMLPDLDRLVLAAKEIQDLYPFLQPLARLRISLVGPPEAAFRLSEVAELAQHGAKLDVCCCPAGPKPDRMPVRLGCFRKLSLLRQRVSQIVAGVSHSRFESDRVPVLVDRLLRPAPIQEHIAKIVVSPGIAGPQCERAPELLFGLGKATLIFEEIAEVVAGFMMTGGEPDRSPVMQLSFAQALERMQCVAHVTVEIGNTRVASDRFADELDGKLVLAALLSDHTEQMQAIDIVRIYRQDLAIEALGFHEVAGLVQGASLCEQPSKIERCSHGCRERLGGP